MLRVGDKAQVGFEGAAGKEARPRVAVKRGIRCGGGVGGGGRGPGVHAAAEGALVVLLEERREAAHGDAARAVRAERRFGERAAMGRLALPCVEDAAPDEAPTVKVEDLFKRDGAADLAPRFCCHAFVQSF